MVGIVADTEEEEVDLDEETDKKWQKPKILVLYAGKNE